MQEQVSVACATHLKDMVDLTEGLSEGAKWTDWIEKKSKYHSIVLYTSIFTSLGF